MDDRGSESCLNRNSLRKGLEAAALSDGALRVSKRGIYLIAGDRKTRSFQLIPWEQILERLREPIR